MFGERQRGSNILGTGSSGQKTCEREREPLDGLLNNVDIQISREGGRESNDYIMNFM